MVNWVMIVLGMQLAGELTAKLLALPVPGPVIGMVLLFALLLYLGEVPKSLDALTEGLLRNLFLFYIPAAVGVTGFVSQVSSQLGQIVLAIAISSILGLLVTGLLLQWLGQAEDR